MRRWIGALAGLLLCSVAHAEIINVTPAASGGGGGSFPPTGCVTANGIVFNNATPCDSGLTYAGSGGAVQLNSDVSLLGETTGVLSLRDGASQPDSMRIYHDYTSGSNYSRMELGFNAHAGVAAIDVAAATSTLPNFGIYVGGTIKLDYGVTSGSRWIVSSADTIYAGQQTGASISWNDTNNGLTFGSSASREASI